MKASPTFVVAAKVSQEAEALSKEILDDIELRREQLSIVVLKVIRLARILSDSKSQDEFEQESGGRSGLGLTMKSTEELEYDVSKGKAVLQGAYQGTSQNSSPYEKEWILKEMDWAVRQLSARRTRLHSYVARMHYEIRFSGLAYDVFERIQTRVDSLIGNTVPDAVAKLVSAYQNLASSNPEDWSNSAHSCRRILQDLADAVFAPQDEARIRQSNGKQTEVRLGPGNYINRLVAYVEDSSESRRFTEVVGSHLRYMGDRLDAIFAATQKGSHNTLTKEEADRCVVYTYLLVGDVLLLREKNPDDKKAPS